VLAASGAVGAVLAAVTWNSHHGPWDFVWNLAVTLFGCAMWAASGTALVRRTGAFAFPLLGFLIIAVTNLWGFLPEVMLGGWFILVAVWTGLWLPRGATLLASPFAALSYILPLLGGAPRSPSDLAAVLVVVPIAVLAGECVAAGAADQRRVDEAQRQLLAAREAARAAIARREHYYRALVERVQDYVIVLGPGSRPRYASPALLDLVGLPVDQLADENGLPRFVSPDDLPVVATALERAFATPGETVRAEVHVRAGDGAEHYCVGTTTNLLDDPAVNGVVVVLHDITENKVLEEQLRHQALHDSLTGLPNRALLGDRLAQMAARSRRNLSSFAVMYIDLDNFKHINDSLGHDAGDELLQAVADRLVSALRDGDTVGRLGGDEFVVLAEDNSQPLDPEALAQRLLAVLERPFTVDAGRRQLSVTASIGVAFAIGVPPERLMRDADVALYRAKSSGRHSYVVFEPEMCKEIEARLSLEMDLHGAVERGEFFLLYQPVIDLQSLEMTGVEALLRWRHPTRGVLAPDRFITLLEETGLIVDVGRWALRTACEQAAAWSAAGLPIAVSVNVSARQLEYDFVKVVRSALRDSTLDPHLLVLEITESVLLHNTDAVIRQLTELHNEHIRIAIDDFGTGYSSMSYLRDLPIDILKIDRSFVTGIHDGEQAATLVRTLVSLGGKLGLVTVAEGIEDVAQLDELRGDLCRDGQGYLFARPLPAPEIERFGRRGAVTAVNAVGAVASSVVGAAS